jgi:hypothetical protein
LNLPKHLVRQARITHNRRGRSLKDKEIRNPKTPGFPTPTHLNPAEHRSAYRILYVYGTARGRRIKALYNTVYGEMR